MLDQEQQLLAAATHYLARLNAGDLISVEAFAATVDPDLRTELVPYLLDVLDSDDPLEPITLTPAEQALAERVTARTLARLAELRAAPMQTLTAVRASRRLSVKALAQRIDLPVDLLARIERGGVAVTSLPGKLIARLATALAQTEAQMRAVLQVPPADWGKISPQLREAPASYTSRLAPSGVRLHAQDGTVPQAEQVMTFADALLVSTATSAQRAEWQAE
ncbi:MAG: XRE family transcriptional regulator [Herpetosiphonaceae bacterium]|nr:XRE family transcriptional regulator [Herpetosiphonaceae bacterium]